MTDAMMNERLNRIHDAQDAAESARASVSADEILERMVDRVIQDPAWAAEHLLKLASVNHALDVLTARTDVSGALDVSRNQIGSFRPWATDMQAFRGLSDSAKELASTHDAVVEELAAEALAAA